MMQSELLRLVGERLINGYGIDNFDHNFGNDRESDQKRKVLETLVRAQISACILGKDQLGQAPVRKEKVTWLFRGT
jgi:hypothetical protein